MAPKRNPREVSAAKRLTGDNSAELSEEGQRLLAFFSEQLENVKTSFSGELADKEKEISSLRNEVHSLRKRLARLDDKIDEAEVYERKDNVIVSGDDLPTATDGEVCSQVLCSTIRRSLKLEISENDIS